MVLRLFYTVPAPPLDSAANSGAFSNDMVGFKWADNSTSLYGCLVLRGSPAAGYSDGELTARFNILQN
jgi:hypothetical protein